ncbi:MAG: preprotein translocase subunit YajC [Planctomycetota bacterium]|jgi:preprotein translocase subunit YajC|nr:preprotein translocase subunit YajC [Planctomycetota bacterium]
MPDRLLLILASPEGASPLVGLAPFAIMFFIFWILLIRPQKKRHDQRMQVIKNLQRNDHIVTMGGLFGTILKIHDDRIVLRICDKTNAQITVTKNSIAGKVSNGTETSGTETGGAS